MFELHQSKNRDCRMKKQKQKTWPNYMLFTRHFKFSDIGELKLQGCKNMYNANINLKNTETTVPIPDKVYFKAKNITRDKEGHYTVIKGSVHQKDMRTLNGHSSDSRGSIHEAKAC